MQGLVRKLLGDIAPVGKGLANNAWLEDSREEQGITEGTGDRLSVRPYRRLLGDAPQGGQCVRLDAEKTCARRAMGLASRLAQSLVDPVDRVRIAVPARCSLRRAPQSACCVA